MRHILYLCKATIAVLLFHTFPALAQPVPDPEPTRPRFTAGIDFGAAVVSLVSLPGRPPPTGVGIALSWRLGYRLSDRTALVLHVASAPYDYRGTGRPRTRSFEGLFPSIQYWVTPRLWISAGPGLSLDMPAFYDIDEPSERTFEHGLGALGIVGYELHRSRTFAIEVLARGQVGYADVPEGRLYGSSASVLIGISR